MRPHRDVDASPFIWASGTPLYGGSTPVPPRIALFLLALVLAALGGCTADKAAAPATGYAAAGDISYSRTGAGFNPEGPAGAAGQTPPAFKNMSNLYGEMSQIAESPLGENLPAENNRKLIKNARIRTKVDNLEEAAAHVEAVLERYQAYASDSSVYDTSRTYTLKIPSAHYETVLTEVGNIGKIVYRSETVEDTTLKYYDLDGKLNTRLELLKTFRAYLGKAETIEEIMTVEKRIAELQQEIDWYGSQLAALSHLVDYATISLELQGPDSETTYYKPSVTDRIAALFRSFSGVASTALLILLGILIYGIPALLVLILLFLLFFGRIGLIRRVWRLVGTKKKQG
ncbi:MAG: DUF4349 domain-containing protein [Treponema sp.]|jgi:hypothetical protein|nr:DUF4349 domain-containing protein [Treponema sp.]